MNCTTFQNQFGEIKRLMIEAGDHMQDYLANPALYPDYPQQISEVHSKAQEFRADYEKSVKDMLFKFFRAEGWHEYTRENIDEMAVFEQNGRVVIKSGETGRFAQFGSYVSIDAHPYPLPCVIRKVSGNLSIDPEISKSADYIEEVDESVVVGVPQEGKDIQILLNSMDRLRLVGDDLRISFSSISELPALEKVGNHFIARNKSSFKSAPNLESVGGYIDIELSKVTSIKEAFPKLKSIGIHEFPFPNNVPNPNGIDKIRISLVVATEEQKKEAEALKASGQLSFDGDVYVKHPWENLYYQ